MNDGTRFLFGKSLFGNCGDYVIVEGGFVDSLKRGAREARQIVARASNAQTFGENERILNELPGPFSVNLEQCTTEGVMGPEVWTKDPTDFPLTPEPSQACLDVIFEDCTFRDHLPYSIVDRTACYLAVDRLERVVARARDCFEMRLAVDENHHLRSPGAAGRGE